MSSKTEREAEALSHAKRSRQQLKPLEENVLMSERRILRKMRVKYTDGQTTQDTDYEVKIAASRELAQRYNTDAGDILDIFKQTSDVVLNRERCIEFNVPLTKECIECDRVKPTSEFYADRRNFDGCYTLCKDCFRKYMKRRRLSAA